MNKPFDWQRQPLRFSGLHVGPAAWHVNMLGRGHRDYVAAHPSLLVCDENHSTDDLTALRDFLKTQPRDLFPVMLRLREPEFARHLPQQIRSRMAAMELARIDIVVLDVQEAAELKSGGSMQHLMDLRSAGLIGKIGISHDDVSSCQWLALTMSAHVLLPPYGLADQSAKYRTLKAAADSEMDCIARNITSTDRAALAFALGEKSTVLPVLDEPLPGDFVAMNGDEIQNAWEEFQRTHHAPPPLPRSHPPQE